MSAVRAAPAASSLSARSALARQPVAARVAAAPGMTRVVRLVCEARQAPSAAANKGVFAALSSVELPAAVRPMVAAGVANALMVSPALAKEAGKIFDFNATLPAIAVQFLVLMVILDKLVYAPVGEVLDKRDTDLKSKLASVKDNSGELDGLMSEANAVISEARNAVQDKVAAAKKATSAANEEKLAAAKTKVDAELASALTSLNSSQEATMKDLESSAEALSDAIVAKCIPLKA